MQPDVLKNLIEELQKLPSIGPKSAARLAYYFVSLPKSEILLFSNIVKDLAENIIQCQECYNYTDSNFCKICRAENRNKGQLMVVENPLDSLAFEETGNYKGLYHILGGVISPVNGIGPDDLKINELFERVKRLTVGLDRIEIIIATNPNMEGEATSSYLIERFNDLANVDISTLARGIPTGADLEYVDPKTLQRALEGRKSL